MDTFFVIQNQDGHYLGKNKEWTDGRDKRSLYRSAQKDDVINLVFELSSKNIDLRASYLECELDDTGNPVVKPSDIPLPLEAANGEAGELTCLEATPTAPSDEIALENENSSPIS